MENIKYWFLVFLALAVAGLSMWYYFTHCWGMTVGEMPAQCLLIR